MKIVTILSAAVLTIATLPVHATEKQVVAKAPVLMTDAQMKEVVGGARNVGAGFGICTAVLKAGASGATTRFGPNVTDNLPGKALIPGPGFGLQTAGKFDSGCIGEVG